MKDKIHAFFEEVESYQRNHYGTYDRQRFVEAYSLLSNEVRAFLKPPTNILPKLWRGCDSAPLGEEEKKVISFSPNKGLAHLFGYYVIPFKELIAYGALISSEKCVILAERLFKDINIGDDEGEVFVVLPRWKPTLDVNKYRVD